MKPGHPHLTEEFDKRRADQRSAREVLTEWDRRTATDDPSRNGPWTFDFREVPPPKNALRAEVACRQVIEARLAPHRAWLDKERSYQSARILENTLRLCNEQPWTTIYPRLGDATEPSVPADPREFSKEVHTLLGLLVLADYFVILQGGTA